METLGNYLRALRLRKNLGQEAIAQMLGASHTLVSHYEAGRKIPSTAHAKIYVKQLGGDQEIFLQAFLAKKAQMWGAKYEEA